MDKPKGFNRNKASCNLDQDDLEMFQQNPQQEWEEQQQVFSCVKVKLNQDISDPSFYSRLTNRIEQLTESDILELYIDTNGGDAEGMLALVDAIENTPAEVVAVLTGRVYSAGSVIALHCPQIQVGPYARMMIHAGRGGLFGKDNEVEANFEFNKKFYKKLFYDTYKHFLTDQEIEEVLNGRDIWLDSEQILERLECKNELLLAEQNSQEASEDPDDEYCVQPLEYDPEDVAFKGKEYYVVAEVFGEDSMCIISAPDYFDNSVSIYDDFNEGENEGTITLFKLIEVLPDVA